MNPDYQPSGLYNAHRAPNTPAAPPVFPVASPVISPSVLNTPRLPPGSGIIVGGTDDDYEDDKDDEDF